uniref:Uracil-DNA glycosylase n=1 Tax=Otarine gammaherpesvirus 4 TaxID=2801541 RepID=A0A889IW17_9GAMA|nr:Uracil-DNA glycosylase [Otarine gammaherpesvirus 4]
MTMDAWLCKFAWIDANISNAVKSEDLLVSAEWLDFLQLSPFLRHKLYTLLEHVRNLRKNAVIYPPEHLMMQWSYECKPENIKVVILGQDPYHRGQANGLAFSVDHGHQVPPSLHNIFTEVEATIAGFCPPNHGCLQKWAKRGVLLLNTVLTVEEGKPGSHADVGWSWFTNYIISSISDRLRHCVFMLWGCKAIDKACLIDDHNHLVLKARHPSPLAQRSRRTSQWPTFCGCGHFSAANKYLKEKGRGEIDWSLNP